MTWLLLVINSLQSITVPVGSRGPRVLPDCPWRAAAPRPQRRSCVCTCAASHSCPHGCLSQTRLLTHSDRDVIVPIILSYEGHHWPVLGGVSGVDCDELLGVILGQPVHLDGVANSICKEEHFNLGRKSK